MHPKAGRGSFLLANPEYIRNNTLLDACLVQMIQQLVYIRVKS